MSLGAGAANAATSPAWRPGPSGVAGTTTAVTGVRSSGTTTEFAFVTSYSAHQMYVRTNSGAWIKKSGPALAKGETVVEAKALSPNHLVAFTVLANGTSRVLSYNQGKWTVTGQFGAPIGTATALSGSDIWVFGSNRYANAKALGVWHYNGKSWSHVGASAINGTGVTATSAWASKGTDVEHYASGKWTATNLASLIPQGHLGSRSLVGVYATPGSPVYAVGSGNNEDQGGPIVVLQLSGSTWKKVASYPGGNMSPTAVSSDGKGGLIIGGSAGAGASAELLHYAKGSRTLAAESVPGMTNVHQSAFATAADVPGTTTLVLGGAAPTSNGIGRATIYTSN